jgi:hypothetical protein
MKMTAEKKALRLLERTVAKSDRFKIEEKANRILRNAVDDVAQLNDECGLSNSPHVRQVWRRIVKHAKEAQATTDILLGPIRNRFRRGI